MGIMPFDLEIDARELNVPPAAAHGPDDPKLFGMNGFAKRVLDLLIAVPALIFLLPVLLIAALAVKLEDGGKVFFHQPRIGRNGKLFPMLKFRSMRPDAEAVLEELLARCPKSRDEWGDYQKLRRDPRITQTGRFLRASSIDELPQLLNVIRGEMSIVGQRPILPSQRDAYGVHIAGYERARPGITGLWQIRGRSQLNFEARAIIGSEYVNTWSLGTDVKIIVLTVPAVLFSKDAF